MRKFLFLDVDGVLNCETTADKAPCGATGLDQSKLNLLDEIIERTGCFIVLSSTWRLYPVSLRYLFDRMRDTQHKVIGRTPDRRKLHGRGLEIEEWLMKHGKNDRFVILDDDRIVDDPDSDIGWILKHFVETTWETGLTAEIAEEVIERLNHV